MSAFIYDVERNIDKLLSTGFGEKHNVAITISDIPELRHNDYDDLRTDMIAGNVIVRQAPGGPQSGLFSLFATKAQSFLFNILSITAFALPVAGIALGLFVNWWGLLLLLVPVVTMPLAQRVYLAALFGSIGSSEKAFCFAFCANAITVEVQDGTICYRGMGNQGIQPTAEASR